MLQATQRSVTRNRGCRNVPNSCRLGSGTRGGGGVHLGMPKITLAEARAAGEELGLPPIITLQEAALIARQSPFTIKRKVSEGYFPKSARAGKPLRFWRDKYIVELMRDRRR